MTLDEAIAHAREVAMEQKRRSGTCVTNDNECDKFSNCIKCAEEHEQLAEWLEELKILKSLKNCSFMTIGKTVEQFEQEIKYKAIDDFAELLRETRDNRTLRVNCDDLEIRHMAERLKRGDAE